MERFQNELKRIPEAAVHEAAEALYYFLKEGAVLLPGEADGTVNINYKKLYSELEAKRAFVLVLSPGAFAFLNVLDGFMRSEIKSPSFVDPGFPEFKDGLKDMTPQKVRRLSRRQ